MMPFLLAVMVAMALAGNLRQSKQSIKMDEMVALVNNLAVKYDCHAQEANLQDTLKTILTKNEAAQTKAGTDYVTEVCQHFHSLNVENIREVVLAYRCTSTCVVGGWYGLHVCILHALS